MGWKLGYATSLDGARAKEGGPPGAGRAIGTGIAILVTEDAGAECDELAELAKPSG